MSHSPKATTPGNAEFVERYYEMFPDAKDLPEDVADAYAAGQVLAAAVTAVGAIDQDKIADWLHANTVETILGPLSWDEAGRPLGEFMIAQCRRAPARSFYPKAPRLPRSSLAGCRAPNRDRRPSRDGRSSGERLATREGRRQR